MSDDYRMSEIRKAFNLRPRRVEDSEYDIKVVDLESPHNTKNTTTSACSRSSVRRSRVMSRMEESPSSDNNTCSTMNNMTCVGAHEKTADERKHELLQGIHGLLQMPSTRANNNDNDRNDRNKQPAFNNATGSTNSAQIFAQIPAQVSTQSPDQSPTLSPTQTPTSHTSHTTHTTTTSSSKVSKSNPTHIELFKTLSPSQKIGRRQKLKSIKSKLQEKSVDELTALYNSTEDPDFRVLRSKVYYENCMARLDDWEEKL